MEHGPEHRAAQPRSLVALWLQVIGPPVIWLVQFQVKYTLAASVTGRKHPMLLLATTVIAAALVILLAVFATDARRNAAASPLDISAGVTARNRFMAITGLMSCGLFFLLIIAQGLADFFFEPGQQ